MEASVDFPGLSFATLIYELRREAAARKVDNDRLIAKGNITQADGAQRIALIHAWIEDAQRIWNIDAGGPVLPRRHRFTWIERRAGLLRELAKRTRDQLITEADRVRIRCLECQLWFYETGFDWEPHNGVAPAWGNADPTPEQQASRDQWRAIMAQVTARTGQQPDLPIT